MREDFVHTTAGGAIEISVHRDLRVNVYTYRGSVSKDRALDILPRFWKDAAFDSSYAAVMDLTRFEHTLGWDIVPELGAAFTALGHDVRGGRTALVVTYASLLGGLGSYLRRVFPDHAFAIFATLDEALAWAGAPVGAVRHP